MRNVTASDEVVYDEVIPATPSDYLPPPTRHMLWYAVRGWAMERHVRPVPGATCPGMHDWLPSFIALLGEPDWRTRMHRYAVAAARQDGLPGILIECIDRCFEWHGTNRRLIREIAERVAEGRL
jgi:hypothetical protein